MKANHKKVTKMDDMHDMNKMHYRQLLIMAGLSFVAMYFLM